VHVVGIALPVKQNSCTCVQVLSLVTEDAAAAGAPSMSDLDIAGQLAAFGRRYVASDSTTALHYCMAGRSSGWWWGAGSRARLFRELLVQSKDYGGPAQQTAELSNRGWLAVSACCFLCVANAGHLLLSFVTAGRDKNGSAGTGWAQTESRHLSTRAPRGVCIATRHVTWRGWGPGLRRRHPAVCA